MLCTLKHYLSQINCTVNILILLHTSLIPNQFLQTAVEFDTFDHARIQKEGSGVGRGGQITVGPSWINIWFPASRSVHTIYSKYITIVKYFPQGCFKNNIQFHSGSADATFQQLLQNIDVYVIRERKQNKKLGTKIRVNED